VVRAGLNSQTLAAFGATCIDHGTAAAGLHANEETVGARAANFRRLVSAFHVKFLLGSVEPARRTQQALLRLLALNTIRETHDYRKFYKSRQCFTISSSPATGTLRCTCQLVDKGLINYNGRVLQTNNIHKSQPQE
jgi:hypothetical protein